MVEPPGTLEPKAPVILSSIPNVNSVDRERTVSVTTASDNLPMRDG